MIRRIGAPWTLVLVLALVWMGTAALADAEMKTINGQQYFVYNNVWYQALYGGSGMVYMVVDDPSR